MLPNEKHSIRNTAGSSVDYCLEREILVEGFIYYILSCIK